jgi:4-amino-4-deoxy-L-arabinose transferase-like glycosyltransferase
MGHAPHLPGRGEPSTVPAAWEPTGFPTTILGLPLAALLIAAGTFGLLLLVAAGYGFHRDELYFILAGRHPDWGYVDQPPLTPLLSAAGVALLGLSPVSVRLLPAIVAAGVVLLTADLARRFGAGRLGQALAALIVALSGWLGAGHLDVTVTYDIFFWTLGLWLLVPLLATQNAASPERWRWLAAGLVAGVALENKTLAVSLLGTVALGLVLLRRSDILRQPWPWLAGLLALAIWSPNLIWQAQHDFPQLAMARSIAADQGPGIDGRLKAIAQLIAIAGPLLFPVAIAGTVWLCRARHSQDWRPLGVAVLLQLGLMLALDGKSYYSAGFLPLAIAAGAVPLEGWLGRGRVAWRRATFGLATIASGATVALIMLPIVPVGALHATPIPDLYAESVAQVGWPALATQVGRVVASLPLADQTHAVIVTETYGEYAALTLLGTDLPPVYSGHNSTWDWGQPPAGAGPVILVAFDQQEATADFARCRVAATLDNGYDLATQEQGQPVWICVGPRVAWPSLWPSLRHIN